MSFEWRRLRSSRELALRKDLEERSVVVAAELAELKDNGPCAVERRIVCSAMSAQIRNLTNPPKGLLLRRRSKAPEAKRREPYFCPKAAEASEPVSACASPCPWLGLYGSCGLPPPSSG